MDQIRTTLRELGLNEKEIAIYLALLSVGSAPASVLGQRTTIKRSTARYTCQQLHRKGLVSRVQKGDTQIFSYEPPEKLKLLLQRKKQEIERKEGQVDRILGDLKRMINPQAVLPKMRFYEGVDGIIELFEDALKESSTIFGALTLNQTIHPDIQRYNLQKYIPKRKALGNPAWMIFNDNEVTKQYQKQDLEMNRKSLLVPYEAYPFDSCFHIYRNKVAFYSYTTQDMTGVVIENKIIHDAQLSFFRLAWERARQLEQNKQYSHLDLPF